MLSRATALAVLIPRGEEPELGSPIRRLTPDRSSGAARRRLAGRGRRTAEWPASEDGVPDTVGGGRPFVWLDDEVTDADRRWVKAHHPGRALLHRIDPYVGLTDADFH